MKKVIILFLTIFCIQTFAQQKLILNEPRVDKRVELLSIVFRLAEKPEYSSKDFMLYTDIIESHFNKYRNHELIEFTKSIINKDGIGYDAVMSMAIHLDDRFNLIKNTSDISLDSRWNKENTNKFISLLKKFHKDTQFEKFFKNNTEFYTETSNRFMPVYNQINLEWYNRFYGEEPKGKFNIVNGLGNGHNNYGISISYIDGRKDIYAIMGAWSVDNSGMVTFSDDIYVSTLIHEFNHSFVNYLTEQNKEELRKSGEKIFSIVENEMKAQAYGEWQIMINEAMVRAAVIKYLKDHNYSQKDINNAIQHETAKGFLWIKGLVGELDKYDTQRVKYTTLESYMPQVVEAYERYTKTIQDFDNKRPKVISINEFSNGDTFVSADIKTITVNFDKPLLAEKGYSIFYGEKGKGAFPLIEKVEYQNNNKTVVIQVKIEKNKEYQFIMKGQNFVSVEGIGIKDYEIYFRTNK